MFEWTISIIIGLMIVFNTIVLYKLRSTRKMYIKAKGLTPEEQERIKRQNIK